MELKVNSTKVKTVYVGSTKAKQVDVVSGGVRTTVYRAELLMVVDSTLQDDVTFTLKNSQCSASTSGVTMTETAYSGAYFGMNVSMLSGDIRDFTKIVYGYTRSGVIGQTGYFPVRMLVGTEAQISGVTFTAYNTVNLNGCTQLYASDSTNGAITGEIDIPTAIKTSSDAQYIAFMTGTYNGTSATLVLNNIKCE